MGRPKIKNKKKTISLSINIEIDVMLEKLIKDKNVSKSQYIEYLIKKDMDQN